MNQDVEKYVELLKTNEAMREKLEDAAKNYTGEKTEEAVFRNLIQPAAKEAGLSFTEEEYKSYFSNNIETLDLDEMDQVAGGTMGGGVGITVCAQKMGVGIGGTYSDDGSNICVILGYGDTDSICVGIGTHQRKSR